jgi:hypothetical protein
VEVVLALFAAAHVRACARVCMFLDVDNDAQHVVAISENSKRTGYSIKPTAYNLEKNVLRIHVLFFRSAFRRRHFFLAAPIKMRATKKNSGNFKR